MKSKQGLAVAAAVVVALPLNTVAATDLDALHSVLRNAGIAIAVRQDCDEDGKGWTAHYMPDTNSICISRLVYNHPPTYWQVLAHEAVHAAQDCKDGISSPYYQLLGITPTGLTNQEKQWVAEVPALLQPIEAEAYALDNQLPLVTQLVAKYCL